MKCQAPVPRNSEFMSPELMQNASKLEVTSLLLLNFYLTIKLVKESTSTATAASTVATVK
jgi:hypothetical protein